MIIGVVPVRCGSKSILYKNIKPFCGKPLIFWCLEALEYCNKIDEIYVATDCEEVASVVKSFGFLKVKIYRRDPKSAQDTSPTEDVILEFIQNKKLASNDIFILVQATNPFLRSEDICEAVDKYLSERYDSLLSVVRFKRFLWSKDGTPINYDYKSRPRRQDFGGIFLENGAFYINKVEPILKNKNRLFGKIGLYEMPEYSWIEMDEPIDWVIGERIMREYQRDRIIIVKSKNIKLFLSDVDGTLTDGGMYYSKLGEEFKKFNTRDGMGFELLKKSGKIAGIITKEDSEIVKKRAEKLSLDLTLLGIDNKLKAVKEICKSLNISLKEVAYIGDDINDISLLKAVGISACPSNAIDDVKSAVDIILTKRGGKDCVREFIDLILKFSCNENCR